MMLTQCEEFKETHLGPLKSSLSGRSTSTSTIKGDGSDAMDEKMNTTDSTFNPISTTGTTSSTGSTNGIGM